MRILEHNSLNNVVGGSSWDAFWEAVGNSVGSWVAESAYDAGSKELHDIGTGKSSTSLNEFLTGQNDPLL